MAFNPEEHEEIVNRRVGLTKIVAGNKSKENKGYEDEIETSNV